MDFMRKYILNIHTGAIHNGQAPCHLCQKMKESNKKYGQTLLLVTHGENIALQADRIITIADGKVVRDERQVAR